MARQIGTKRVEVEDVSFLVRWSLRDMLAFQKWVKEEISDKGEESLADTMVFLEKLIISWEGFVDQDGVPVAYAPDQLELLDPELATKLIRNLVGGTPGEAPSGNATDGSSEPTAK